MLELGCGDGGNLVPMAYGLTGSTFAGVDLSGRAIERARARAAALGLENVRFELADLEALTPWLDWTFAEARAGLANAA